MSPLPVGSIRFEAVSRCFQVAFDPNRTLKERAVRKRTRGTREFWAVRDLDLFVKPGESVGVVGRNGSGKSTILKLIAGILRPTSGDVRTAGSVASMLELGAGFHPDFTGRENLYLNGAIFGLSEREVDAAFDDIVDFAEVADFIDAPVRTYSSGMQMRLAFAVASHVRADIMLLDEVFAVGDEAFQRKCLGRMHEFRRHGGTIVFVSHDASAVQAICDRALLMENGVLHADGPAGDVMDEYHRLLATGDSRRAAGVGERVPDDATQPGATHRRPVSLGEMRLTDSTGRTSTAFQSGDEVAVEIEYHVDQPVDTLNIAFTVSSTEGHHCFSTSSARDGCPLDPTRSGRLRYVIPRLPLLEGQFAFSVLLTDLEGIVTFHNLARCLDFDVFSRSRANGIVEFAGKWEAQAPTGETIMAPAATAESDR